MDKQKNTALLVMAFNRPNTTEQQLGRIQDLSKRNIHISIDGPRNTQDEEKCLAVQKITEAWATKSHHKVSITSENTNLGLHRHFMKAFSDFFSSYDFGMVLEDDIEFRNSFVDFIDRIHQTKDYRDYWSVQGYNPLDEANNGLFSQEIRFTKSNFHSVWGWASHSHSVERMLKFIADSKNPNVIQTSIEKGARLFTSDPVLRMAIRNVWLKKLLRAQSLESGGWDNWWVASAWLHQMPSLMPNVSISRETLNQLEGQSHRHTQIGISWTENQKEEVFFEKEFGDSPTGQEIRLLRTWGITRPYSWYFAPRVYKQYSNLQRKLETDVNHEI
jgi:hypothetical protein